MRQAPIKVLKVFKCSGWVKSQFGNRDFVYESAHISAVVYHAATIEVILNTIINVFRCTFKIISVQIAYGHHVERLDILGTPG